MRRFLTITMNYLSKNLGHNVVCYYFKEKLPINYYTMFICFDEY